MILTRTHVLHTSGQDDVRDVTGLAAAALAESGLAEGLITVFVVGSTAGITTVEYESGAIEDLNRLLERLAARRGEYRHHLRWGDDNGSSHVRAALIGPSVTVPFTGGQLRLGTWQQIVLMEFDTRARDREVVVQVMGE